MHIILASASPRRKELLHKILSNFEIIPANIDEDQYPLNMLSLIKAQEIANTHPSSLIISADTVVILDEQVLGKPKDEDDAFDMLKKLSSRVHEVSTFYTIYSKENNISITRQVTSLVYFNKLSDELIKAYIATKSPLDKAGAYGIQDKEFPLIEKIEGEEDNVIGLPLQEIKKDLLSLGIHLKE